MESEAAKQVLITNDAVVLGLIMLILAFIFRTSSSAHPFWTKFYTYVPSILLCYFLPSLLNSLRIIDGASSQLYFVASRYLLPASLVLLTLSIDLKTISKLGFKAVIMFFTGTIGIILGGPLAILIMIQLSPDVVAGTGADEIWRGLATVAGSWIGGGANQTAMYEVFGASAELFSMMIAVDVVIANLWMAFLLYGANISSRMDRIFKADASAIEDVRQRIEDYRASVARMPTLADTMTILALGLTTMGLSHIAGDLLGPYFEKHAPVLERFSLTSPFFWIVVTATTVGLALSFTKFRKYEGVGASRIGSAMLYVLVAAVGTRMDITAIFEAPELFMVGFIWMLVHAGLLLIVAKLIRAPFFFIAVGSQANVGGAASAPIVASAFNPSLAPVGVLLAVLGYAVGTYGAWLCGILMQWVAPV